MSVESTVRAVTTYRLTEMKQRGEKIAMLTSYDYSMARIVDAAGIDVILVGDSAANVMAGYETTLPITLDMMIYHARSVVPGNRSIRCSFRGDSAKSVVQNFLRGGCSGGFRRAERGRASVALFLCRPL